jgi:hypothetical protein
MLPTLTILPQGDLEKHREDQAVFLTVHDVGTSYLSMVDFFSHQVNKKPMEYYTDITGKLNGIA